MEKIKKTVLITGSTKGIGLGIAKKFLKENFQVIINSRKNFGKKFYNYKFIKGDVTKKNDIKKISKIIKKKYKKLDVLVCNVGFSKYTYKEFPSLDELNDSLNKNFYSCFLIINELKNLLIKSKSRIVCISSICGVEVIKNAPISYSVSKSLLNSYLKFISKSFAKYGVKLNIVSPGNILFKGSTWDKKLKKNKKNTIKYIKNSVPLKKFGKPEDIADAVFFLSSDKNNFVSGANFILDGGQTSNFI